jgi:hypothetical protein
MSSEQQITLKDIWEKLADLTDIRADVGDIKLSVVNLSEVITSVKSEVESVRIKCTKLEEENGRLFKKIEDLENQSRRSNLIFYNVPEDEKEEWSTTESKVLDIVNKTMKVSTSEYDIERAHRLGRKGQRNRPIIVRFAHFKKKDTILRAAKHLRQSRIQVTEDYSKQVRETRSKLKKFMIEARKRGHFAQLWFDRLKIDGAFYTLQDLERENKDYGGRQESYANVTAKPVEKRREKDGGRLHGVSGNITPEHESSQNASTVQGESGNGRRFTRAAARRGEFRDRQVEDASRTEVGRSESDCYRCVPVLVEESQDVILSPNGSILEINRQPVEESHRNEGIRGWLQRSSVNCKPGKSQHQGKRKDNR